MFKSLYIMALAFLLGAGGQAVAEDGGVRISGSTSVANGIVLPHQTEIETAANAKIVVTPNSSGAGMIDLFAGRADIAMISSPLEEILAKESHAAKSYNSDLSRLQTVTLGEARIEFIVNPSNPIRKLSGDQIRAIYEGKITSWKELGGPAVDVEAVAESRHGAMRAMLEHRLLGGHPVADLVNEAKEAPEVATWVEKVPGAIGFVSSTMPKALREGTVTVETEVHLAQPLSLVTQGEPATDAARVIQAIQSLR